MATAVAVPLVPFTVTGGVAWPNVSSPQQTTAPVPAWIAQAKAKPVYETMEGWMHLPRYIDKNPQHVAEKLHADYPPSFGKDFDGVWLKAAGVTHEQITDVVKLSITDGQICDGVRGRTADESRPSVKR